MSSDPVDPVAATVGSLAPTKPARRLDPGSSLGRFVITERLGEGGMGIVVAAIDQTLDRRVAIKVLRGTKTDDRKQRLLREAQALARLSHENVVPVYEAGEADDEIYVVMELVSGRTLTRWLADARRGWREIVSAFAQAGRGLEAAHAAGLVHRDFKPDNVLIGSDGRVRVTDFGIAAAHAETTPQVRPSGDDLLAARLTVTGVLVGTPAYMAPEQYAGSVNPRTDQFAFCVALYHALFERLPFTGGTSMEYLANASENNVQRPPRDRSHPRWLWRTIVRGLSATPGERFPDMAALLAELDRGGRRRALAVRAAAAGSAAVVFGVVAWKALVPASVPPCGDEKAAVAGVWNDQHRNAVRAAITRSGLPWSARAAAMIEATLDARTQEWGELRVQVCEASHAEIESEARVDLKVSCLDGLLEEIRALVGLFEHADPGLVTRAILVAGAFTPIASCSDARRLDGPFALPADRSTLAEIAAVRGVLAESRALYLGARYGDSLARAKAALARATPTNYAPVVAEAMYRRAVAAERAGADGDPRALLSDTIAAAGAAHHDAVLVDAWTRMARTCAEEWGCDPELAVRMARASLSALGRDDRRESVLLDTEATLAESKGQHAAARSMLEKSLRLAIQAAGNRRDATVARAHGNFGQLLAAQGEDPRAEIEQALAIYRELGGSNHPELAPGLEALAMYAASKGKWQDAEAGFRQALEIRQRAFGEYHNDVAASHNNVAYLLFQAGDFDRSVGELRAALAIYERLEPDGPKVAATVGALGEALDKAGKTQEALASYQRALALAEKAYGPEHREVAAALLSLGRRNRRDGHFDEALAACRRALRIYQQLDDKQASTVRDTLAEIAAAERRDAGP